MSAQDVKESKVRREQRIRVYWQNNRTFERTVQNWEEDTSFVFYEDHQQQMGCLMSATH